MAPERKTLPAKARAKATEFGLRGVDGPRVLHKSGRAEIVVLGTAHVSRESVQDVEAAASGWKPDAICVELCQPRYDALRDPDRWRKLDLSKLVREKKIGLLMSSLILASFQKKIGATAGVQPGAEMVRAAELAEERGVPLYLSDREVRITLVRAWRRVGFFSRLWLASTLLASLLVRDEIEPAEIERLKQEDVISDLFANLPPRYAFLKQVIIDERDQFLAEKILQAAEEAQSAKKRGRVKILAVVGAGHLAGVEAALEKGERRDLASLNEIPKAGRLKDILSWAGLSVGVLALSWFIGERRPEEIWQLLFFWIACRSGGAGIGAIAAGANWLTVVVTVAIAPFSIFIFGSRLWMFSALTELWVHKPRVEDFENIATDTETAGQLLRSLYRNRVLNLFWVIMLVSTGLTVGNLTFFSEFIRALLRGTAT